MDEDRRAEAVTALGACYQAVTSAVAGRGEPALLAASRCAGWTVTDVLTHLLLDAQRALVVLAAPAEGPADTDAIGYWERHRQSETSARRSALFVRRSAAAFPTAARLLSAWRTTSEAALALATWVPHEEVTTRGMVLPLPDFLETVVVEAALHLLDLSDAPLAGVPAPLRIPRVAEDIVRWTLDGLLGGSPPARWDLEGYALRADGRRPLTPADLRALGPLADAFPLVG